MIPELRRRVLEAQLNGEQALAEPVAHRLIMNLLFTAYLVLPVSRSEWASEFVDVYAHLLEGKPVDTAPIRLLKPREKYVEQVHAILRGDPTTLTREHHDEEERRDGEGEDEGDEDHDGDGG